MSEWPYNQEWAKEGWPKTAEDIWTLIEMGVWIDTDEKDQKLISFDITQKLYEALNLALPYVKDQAQKNINDCDPCREIARTDALKCVEARRNYEQEVINNGKN